MESVHTTKCLRRVETLVLQRLATWRVSSAMPKVLPKVLYATKEPGRSKDYKYEGATEGIRAIAIFYCTLCPSAYDFLFSRPWSDLLGCRKDWIWRRFVVIHLRLFVKKINMRFCLASFARRNNAREDKTGKPTVSLGGFRCRWIKPCSFNLWLWFFCCCCCWSLPANFNASFTFRISYAKNLGNPKTMLREESLALCKESRHA